MSLSPIRFDHRIGRARADRGRPRQVCWTFTGRHRFDSKGADRTPDIDEIRGCIADDNIDAADRVIADIFAALRTLVASPHTSRRISFSGSINYGDEIRYVDTPYVGSGTGWEASVTLRPISRLQSLITADTNRFTDLRSGTEVFDIQILRATTTYQFTDRLLVRNTLESDSFDRKFGANLLVPYRVNAGTVFFIGYDDRYRQEDRIDSSVFPGTRYERTTAPSSASCSTCSDTKQGSGLTALASQG